jgi:hypothetical protein
MLLRVMTMAEGLQIPVLAHVLDGEPDPLRRDMR